MPATFPLSTTPVAGEPYCRYPYMHVDVPTSRDRLRYFSIHKYQKMLDPAAYTIQPCYFIRKDDFRQLLNIFVNQEGLENSDRLRILFTLYDDGPDVPANCKNSFTFIFATTYPDGHGNYVNKKFFIIDSAEEPGNGVKEITLEDAVKWTKNYKTQIRPKLDGTIYRDPLHPEDSPYDTNSIDYEILGICQVYREIDYQLQKNPNVTLSGIEIYFSSFRTPDKDPRNTEYPSCYPQRVITEIRIIETVLGKHFEFDITDMDDFLFRHKSERPISGFDTGNICPPRCGGSINP